MKKLLFVALLALFPVSVAAQEVVPRFELGLTAGDSPGFEIQSAEFDGALTTVGVYFDVRLGDRWVLSPSVSSVIVADEGVRAGRFRADLRYHLIGSGPVRPYVFGSGTVYMRGRDNAVSDEDQTAVGGGVGVRLGLPVPFAVSLEARYDHWLEAGADQFGLGLRIGVPFGH